MDMGYDVGRYLQVTDRFFIIVMEKWQRLSA